MAKLGGHLQVPEMTLKFVTFVPGLAEYLRFVHLPIVSVRQIWLRQKTCVSLYGFVLCSALVLDVLFFDVVDPPPCVASQIQKLLILIPSARLHLKIVHTKSNASVLEAHTDSHGTAFEPLPEPHANKSAPA